MRSILGPLFFTLYTSNILNCFKKCKYNLYADDTQLYFSFPAESCLAAVDIINADITNLITFAKQLYYYKSKKKHLSSLTKHIRDVKIFQYADDTQLLFPFLAKDVAYANNHQSFFGKDRDLTGKDINLVINGERLESTSSANNLGVVIDKKLPLKEHGK
nr:unnamed protein product [Callosobruchus analis]